MKVQIKNYTFDASAKTITFDDYATIDIDSIFWVINVTDSKALYNPINKFLSGSVTGNVLTVDYDTSFMNDTDELQIYYDKIPDPATESKQDDIVENQLSQLMVRIATNSADTSITYVGRAPIGSATSSAVWQITKYDESVSEISKFAGGGAYNQVFSSRESLTYN
jgi:hypothetical protein